MRLKVNMPTTEQDPNKSASKDVSPLKDFIKEQRQAINSRAYRKAENSHKKAGEIDVVIDGLFNLIGTNPSIPVEDLIRNGVITSKELLDIELATNMRLKDLRKIADACDSGNDAFVITRPMSISGYEHHMEHHATGKGFDIKGKSAEGDVIGAFIPTDATFCKIANECIRKRYKPTKKQTLLGEIDRLNKENKHTIMSDEKRYESLKNALKLMEI